MKLPAGIKFNYVLVTAVLFLAFGLAVYFYLQYQNVKNQLVNPSNFSQAEMKTVIEKVAKLIELPEDELPTIATISDKDKLKNQPFFAKAKNGDKVIIYTNARKAILYDPLTNKIIDVAPINIGSVSASITTEPMQKVSPTPTKKASPTPTKSL